MNTLTLNSFLPVRKVKERWKHLPHLLLPILTSDHFSMPRVTSADIGLRWWGEAVHERPWVWRKLKGLEGYEYKTERLAAG